MSGGGVKGGRGSRTRSGAEGEHRTGEHPAQRTLDADGALDAPRLGVRLGFNPTPCHAASAGFGAEPRCLPAIYGDHRIVIDCQLCAAAFQRAKLAMSQVGQFLPFVLS